MIESEGQMPTEDVVLKELPPVRLAELTATAGSYASEDIGPVIQPLYPELFRRLEAAGVRPGGPAIAYYEPAGDDAVLVHAAAGVSVDAQPHYDFAVVDLPAVQSAATVIHRGAMDHVEQTMQLLDRWIEQNGYRAAGYARELYLEYSAEEPEKGITELQLPVTRA